MRERYNWNAYPYVLTMAAHRSCRLQIAFNIEEAGPGQWSGYQDFKDQDGTSEIGLLPDDLATEKLSPIRC